VTDIPGSEEIHTFVRNAALRGRGGVRPRETFARHRYSHQLTKLHFKSRDRGPE
jgi:hypothetical protein